MDMKLAGASVLITGASKGIGAAAADAFAREGCILHLAARDEAALTELAEMLNRAHGCTAHVHAMDLSRPDSMAALAEAAGDIDVLINNAGDIPAGPVEALTSEDWRRGFDLKVFGYVALTREVYLGMKRRGSGVIINDIGNSGENWDYNYVAGSTGNAALMAFTRAVGGQSMDHGVRVVAVNPGPIATERMTKLMKRRAVDLYGDEDRWQEFLADYPGGRMGKPEEVADLMVFLASPRAGYISGAIFTIDGGIASYGSIIKPRPKKGAASQT